MLDEEFMRAYKDGIVVLCGDGIKRRIFLRIFAYSADYPEKYVFRFPQCYPSLIWGPLGVSSRVSGTSVNIPALTVLLRRTTSGRWDERMTWLLVRKAAAMTSTLPAGTQRSAGGSSVRGVLQKASQLKKLPSGKSPAPPHR